MGVKLIGRWLVALVAAIVLAQGTTYGAPARALVDIFGIAANQKKDFCGTCTDVAFKLETYANGNSDVRLGSDVFGKSILIPIKAEMTPTEYIHLLIMIRVLHNEGAYPIRIIPPKNTISLKVVGQNSNEIKLDHLLHMAAAGAQYFGKRGEPQSKNLEKIRLQQMRKLSRRTPVTDILLDSNVHPELGESLANKLGIGLLSNDQPTPTNKGVLLVYSQVEPVNETLLKTLAKTEDYFQQKNEVHLISPYMPYARGDKADKKGVTAPLALIADLFIQSGVKSVYFVRPHAAQGRLAYSQIIVRETSSYDSFISALTDEKIDAIVSPDAGAQKEATLFADRVTGGEVAVINKQRKGNKIEIRGISISDAFKNSLGEITLKGKVVLILDDESATGGTLAEAAELLKVKYGAARVIAAFTHLTGDAAKALQSPYLDRILVTNTIPAKVKAANMNIVSIANELANLVGPLVESRVRCQASIQRGGQP